MARTVYGRPVPDVLRGLGWATAGVALVVMTVLQIAQQVLGNLTLRPVLAVVQFGAALAWLALCGALAYQTLR